MVPDGAHIGLGGFAITRCTMAFGHELIRQGKKDLSAAVGIATMDLDMMVGTGVVKRIVYGGGSLDAFGPVSQVNQAFCRGDVKIEEYSSLGMTFKFLAKLMVSLHILCSNIKIQVWFSKKTWT